MRSVRAGTAIVTVVVAAAIAAGLAGALSDADAMPADVTSPAGTVTGSTVCLGPEFGAAPPAAVPSPLIVNPKGPLLTPPLSTPAGAIPSPLIVNPKGPRFTPPVPTPVAGVPGPAMPPIILLSPTPATGSFVVPMTVPSVSGTGPSLTQMQLVIPGPNPAQNTTVSLSQLLSSILGFKQPSGASTAPGTGSPGLPSRPVTCF